MKHHTQRTEAGIQYIVTLSSTLISEEDDSTLFFLRSIDIAPIKCDILKQDEVIKRKGNRNMTSGGGSVGTDVQVGDVVDDNAHREGVGRIPPQGGPQDDR